MNPCKSNYIDKRKEDGKNAAEEKRARGDGCGFGPACLDPGSARAIYDKPCHDTGGKRLREGTASSAETTHFLKLATMKADLEKKKLEEENKLLRAKTETLESAKDSKEMYEHVLKAMAKYNGVGEDDEYDFN